MPVSASKEAPAVAVKKAFLQKDVDDDWSDVDDTASSGNVSVDDEESEESDEAAPEQAAEEEEGKSFMQTASSDAEDDLCE